MSNEETRDKLLDIYKRSRDAHNDGLDDLAEIEAACRRMDPELIIDAVYALKQASKYVQDTRVKIDACLQLLQRLGCALVAQTSVNKLEGQWATGTAQVTEQPNMPHPDRNPTEYEAMLRALNVPAEVIAARTLHPRFEAVASIMAKLAEEGRPVPQALQSAKMIARYTLAARSRGNKVALDKLVDDRELGFVSPF